MTGIVSVRERFSLSPKPPRQAPLVRSTSNRPTRPWLTVVNRSTRGRCRRRVRSTVPSAKSCQRTGKTAVSTRAGPSAVSITVPSSARAVAPDGLEIRMSRSSVNGSKPVTRIRLTPLECGWRMVSCPREVRSSEPSRRGLLGFGEAELRLPLAYFTGHAEPRPVQRAVVVPAQVAARRAPALRAVHRRCHSRAPCRSTTRSACAYERALSSARTNSGATVANPERARISWGAPCRVAVPPRWARRRGPPPHGRAGPRGRSARQAEGAELNTYVRQGRSGPSVASWGPSSDGGGLRDGRGARHAA